MLALLADAPGYPLIPAEGDYTLQIWGGDCRGAAAGMSTFALVDGNSFYASCERVFRPTSSAAPSSCCPITMAAWWPVRPRPRRWAFRLSSPSRYSSCATNTV
jgi:hypothetical protein